MNTSDHDTNAISEIVNLYFKGTYQGDVELLKQAFHPAARITGMLNGELFDWSLSEFIDRVTQQPTAAAKCEKYDKEILFIDKTNHAAMVKAQVIMKPFVFTDYITLLKINGKWVIRNKSFTTV